MKNLIIIVSLLLVSNFCYSQDFDCGSVTKSTTQSTRDDIYTMISVFKELKNSGQITEYDLKTYKLGYIELRSKFNTFYWKIRDEVANGHLLVSADVICKKYKNEIEDLEQEADSYLYKLSSFMRKKLGTERQNDNSTGIQYSVAPATKILIGYNLGSL